MNPGALRVTPLRQIVVTSSQDMLRKSVMKVGRCDWLTDRRTSSSRCRVAPDSDGSRYNTYSYVCRSCRIRTTWAADTCWRDLHTQLHYTPNSAVLAISTPVVVASAAFLSISPCQVCAALAKKTAAKLCNVTLGLHTKWKQKSQNAICKTIGY